jgi:nucleoporin NUP82
MSSPVAFSLAALHTHSIFLPATAQPDDDWELVDRPGEPSVPARRSRLAIRDKDLVVAMGKELRMTYLSGEPWEVQEGRVGGYKVGRGRSEQLIYCTSRIADSREQTLTSSHLSFPIQAIVPSPSGKLLAVVGSHQIVIIVLPKSTIVGSASGELPCR